MISFGFRVFRRDGSVLYYENRTIFFSHFVLCLVLERRKIERFYPVFFE
jgi:hypothetical protein